jgi:hypothetical protein
MMNISLTHSLQPPVNPENFYSVAKHENDEAFVAPQEKYRNYLYLYSESGLFIKLLMASIPSASSSC